MNKFHNKDLSLNKSLKHPSTRVLHILKIGFEKTNMMKRRVILIMTIGMMTGIQKEITNNKDIKNQNIIIVIVKLKNINQIILIKYLYKMMIILLMMMRKKIVMLQKKRNKDKQIQINRLMQRLLNFWLINKNKIDKLLKKLKTINQNKKEQIQSYQDLKVNRSCIVMDIIILKNG